MVTRVQDETGIGYVFIHGAGLRSDVWDEVERRLDSPCLKAEFPGRAAGGGDNGDLSLSDYTAYLERQVREWPVQRFVVVAHSIGGLLGLKLCAAMPERAVGFVAVSAAIPKEGKGSFVSMLPFPKKQIMSLILRHMGTRPPESQIRSGLCNDLSVEESELIVRRFVPESVRLYTDHAEAGIPEVPKVYVQCVKDREFSISLQEKQAKHLSAHAVKALDTGHLPMVGDPDGLSRILKQFVVDARFAEVTA